MFSPVFFGVCNKLFPFLWPNQNNQGVERGANGIMKVEISRTFEGVPLNLI